MLIITGFYGAILAFILIWLSFRVIKMRKGLKVAHGTAGDDQLLRRKNAHGNFCEYVPLILLLMATAEAANSSTLALHAIGIATVVGRMVHAIGMTREPENFSFRQTGMILTFLPLAGVAIMNLMRAAQALMAG